MIDILVAGAGPAGMAAAISAKLKNPKIKVVVIEKMKEAGKKLLATGNGHCNISNSDCERKLTKEFFHFIGLALTEEEGRLYPFDRSSMTVRNLLTEKLKELDVELLLEREITSVEKDGDNFVIKFKGNRESLIAKKVILALGGKAGPQYGSIGDGTRIAKGLGHRITPLAPSLSAIETLENTEKLKGIRAKAMVSLTFGDETIYRENGEVQFTDYGLSGICLFNCSHFIEARGNLDFQSSLKFYRIRVDMLFNLDEEEKVYVMKRLDTLERVLVGIKAKVRERGLSFSCKEVEEATDKVIADGLFGIVNLQIAKLVAERYRNLRGEIEIWKILSDLTFKIKNVRGWQYAQVTRGGVSFDEITDTFKSKLDDNLYIVGETTEYSGLCGGFNLEFAFNSGITAGISAASDI